MFTLIDGELDVHMSMHPQVPLVVRACIDYLSQSRYDWELPGEGKTELTIGLCVLQFRRGRGTTARAMEKRWRKLGSIYPALDQVQGKVGYRLLGKWKERRSNGWDLLLFSVTTNIIWQPCMTRLYLSIKHSLLKSDDAVLLSCTHPVLPCRALREEGLFRVSGNKTEILQLDASLREGEKAKKACVGSGCAE